MLLRYDIESLCSRVKHMLCQALRHTIPVSLDRFFSLSYLRDVAGLVGTMLDEHPVQVFGLARVEISEGDMNQLLDRIETILKMYFKRSILYLLSEPSLEFAVSTGFEEGVRMYKLSILFTTSVQCGVRSVMLVARAGSPLKNSGRPRLVPLVKYVNPPASSSFLVVTVSLRVFGCYRTKTYEHQIPLDLTDEEIGRLVMKLLKTGEADVRGRTLRRASQTSPLYCDQSGTICIELEELEGNRGHIVIKPILLVRIGEKTVRRSLKYVVVRGLNGKLTIKDRVIIIS